MPENKVVIPKRKYSVDTKELSDDVMEGIIRSNKCYYTPSVRTFSKTSTVNLEISREVPQNNEKGAIT